MEVKTFPELYRKLLKKLAEKASEKTGISQEKILKVLLDEATLKNTKELSPSALGKKLVQKLGSENKTLLKIPEKIELFKRRKHEISEKLKDEGYAPGTPAWAKKLISELEKEIEKIVQDV